MIHEVDESLRGLIRAEALSGTPAEVLLDAPTKDWAARRSGPVVDLYLYDIREDLRRRTTGMLDERGDDGVMISRRATLRFFKLSYLLTAWTQRPEDEHRLLSALLVCFLRHDTVPAQYLVGALANSPVSIGILVALPPPENHQISDVWSALGGELKASLDLVVTIPVDPSRMTIPAPPVLEPLEVRVSGPEGALDVRRGRPKPQPQAGEMPVPPANVVRRP